MNSNDAEKIAGEILNLLKPFCDKIEIAGSIRRKKEVVNDIDIVLICNDIFNLKIKVGKIAEKILLMGNKVIRFLYKSIQVDLFISDWDNFEVLMLLKTGSREHNIKMSRIAKKMGYKLGANGLINSEGKLITNKEKEIFYNLDLDYVEPEKRD
ncbi:MAG: hypothetical protein AABY32_02755 [Nanoarchaeota archaeon]